MSILTNLLQDIATQGVTLDKALNGDTSPPI
jgi:hypothetical protein